MQPNASRLTFSPVLPSRTDSMLPSYGFHGPRPWCGQTPANDPLARDLLARSLEAITRRPPRLLLLSMRTGIEGVGAHRDRGAAALVCSVNEVARERTAFVRGSDGAAAGRRGEEPRSFPI